jgi:hypothetical protein
MRISSKTSYASTRFVAWITVLFVANNLFAVTFDPSLILTAPERTNGKFQFTLESESGAVCVIESSSNSLSWTPMLTNDDLGSVRTITLDAPDATAFYRVGRFPLPLFVYAVAARGDVNLQGSSFVTDSWNSHDTNLNVNGLYDPLKTSTNGNVGSLGGIVSVGDGTIAGNLYLGPTASFASGMEQVLGTINKDYNVNFPEVTLPSSAATALPPIKNDGTNYLVLDNTTFVVNDSVPIIVDAGLTNVTLIVNAEIFDPASITLQGGMSNAATLTIYDNPPDPGGSVILGGNSAGGAIGARPSNFIFYGMPNLSNLTTSGTSDFIGAIYAPSANATLNSGGNAENIFGSIIARSITVNGHFLFHFDESFLNNGPFY